MDSTMKAFTLGVFMMQEAQAQCKNAKHSQWEDFLCNCFRTTNKEKKCACFELTWTRNAKQCLYLQLVFV